VTGFGFLGHLLELARASRVDVEIRLEEVPLLDGVRELAAAGMVPGGSRDNLSWVAPSVTWPEGTSEVDRLILADAQSSGGLLAAVVPDRAGEAERLLQRCGAPAARVGRVIGAGSGRIAVR